MKHANQQPINQLEMTSRKRKNPDDADISALHKEWDDISCPICMDHPHNAVRILCSAHEKGCTSFICDTSYRHSNCLDRFKKLVTSDTNDTTSTTPSLIPVNDNSTDANAVGYDELSREPGDASNNISSLPSRSCLKCPLCRGSVSGYEVVEEAREYLNLKHRNCSQELCSFSGTYRELRRHARRSHPTARPSDVDPTRERAWRRLENQREYGDIISAIRSAMPGAVMFGDYAIDNNENRERVLSEGSNNGHWLTALFFFQMISSMDSPSVERRGGARTRIPTRHRPRRLFWGESLLGLPDDEVNDSSDEDEDSFRLNAGNDYDERRRHRLYAVNDYDERRRHPEIPRSRRRRSTRYRSDEDRS